MGRGEKIIFPSVAPSESVWVSSYDQLCAALILCVHVDPLGAPNLNPCVVFHPRDHVAIVFFMADSDRFH